MFFRDFREVDLEDRFSLVVVLNQMDLYVRNLYLL